MSLVTASWWRTLTAAAVLVCLGAALVYLISHRPIAHTGTSANRESRPGYISNPFGDQNDLISATDAQRVKEDFLNDGTIEIQAFERSDPSILARSDTGNSLARLQALLQQDIASGVIRRYDDQIQTVMVGHLLDRASPSVTWCVEEMGMSTLTTVRKSDGHIVSIQSYRFDGRFWLLKVSGRYLITDAEVTNTPTPR